MFQSVKCLTSLRHDSSPDKLNCNNRTYTKINIFDYVNKDEYNTIMQQYHKVKYDKKARMKFIVSLKKTMRLSGRNKLIGGDILYLLKGNCIILYSTQSV